MDYGNPLIAPKAPKPVPSRPSTTNPAPRHRRRGMTLLEVVLAAALLATVAATVSGVLSQISRAEQQRRLRLHAYEVANRLTLQYIDDADQLPNPRLPYEDGVYRFRWTIDEVPAEIKEPVNSAVALPERREARNMLGATVVLDVRVYESSDDGVGGTVFGQQLARITRPYTDMPMASSNPDALARGFKDPRKLNELLKRFTGEGGRPSRVERDKSAPKRRGSSQDSPDRRPR